MAITREQVVSIGFKPFKKKSPYAKKYDTLIYPLNKTDYLYLGYNGITKGIDFKRIWKSCIDSEGSRVCFMIAHVGEIGFTELQEYIKNHESKDINSISN